MEIAQLTAYLFSKPGNNNERGLLRITAVYNVCCCCLGRTQNRRVLRNLGISRKLADACSAEHPYGPEHHPPQSFLVESEPGASIVLKPLHLVSPDGRERLQRNDSSHVC